MGESCFRDLGRVYFRRIWFPSACRSKDRKTYNRSLWKRPNLSSGHAMNGSLLLKFLLSFTANFLSTIMTTSKTVGKNTCSIWFANRFWPLHPNTMRSVQIERKRLGHTIQLYSRMSTEPPGGVSALVSNPAGLRVFQLANSEIMPAVYGTNEEIFS